MDNYGPGVSRVLDPEGKQYLAAIHAAGLPPCDAEFTLNQVLAIDAARMAVLRGVPSGWLGNETNSKAIYTTDPSWSNYLRFGSQQNEQAPTYAVVNGWVIPVAGTLTGQPPGSPSADFFNLITLSPPPRNAGDFRIDGVYLEVWKARIQPNPSTTNKPSASGIYYLGNSESGHSFAVDDLIDAQLGFKTTDRLQIQYRIRVVSGLVGLTSNPDGFDPVVVKAQGAASVPTSYTFTNQRVNGDPGLWRAGDGTSGNALGTVDGYSYAIPICVVFRRNSVVWNGSNLNGGFDRNPTAVDRTGYKTFSGVATLSADLSAVATSASLVSVTNIPLPATPATIQIGDEIMTYASITGTTLNTLTRASNGTIAESHKAGSVVRVLSGRPDGLFSDQIALTDILDLRHVVNPNGFDYTSLLKSNLDKLLRGQLRANWKRSGAGPQGPFVFYQDAIQSAAVSLGVTQLDAPDNIRMVFSDAATIQPIECVVQPNTGIVPPGPGVNINVSWSLGLTVKTTNQQTGEAFQAGDIITISPNQLKTGLQAGATDQIRWLNDGVTGAVTLRLDGETGDLPDTMYTVTPAVPAPGDDFTIILGATFPTQTNTAATPTLLHIKVHAVYGPGRGLSRRPDSLHSVSYINPSADLLVQQSGVPSNNQGSRVAWAPLWSKYRSATFNNLLPVTSEIYADLGSKTIILTPFRKINFHNLLTIDGDAANPVPTAKASPTSGTLALNSATITMGATGTAAAGDALIIASGPGAGRYTITTVNPATSIIVDRPIKTQGGATTFTVHAAQGVMPLGAVDGAPKWGTTDPLGLFCSQGAGNLAYNNIYVSLPRHLVPGWGEVRVPVLTSETTTFARGINFMCRSTGGSVPESQSDFVAYYNGGGGSNEYTVFSQVDFTSTPLPYNTAGAGTEGNAWAGMQFFTDTRGLGRQGLELPPFYGVARIFGVYEASDYISAASPFTDQRETGGIGTATNLLRQSMSQSDGPAMWIETDDDGDSTFILNANVIDITKSPIPIASFAAGTYVIEAAIFGFDRGSFDLGSEFRLVLTRPGNLNGWSTVGLGPVDTNPANRASNINKYVAAPTCVLPGPAENSDQVVINYSRTPFQFDAWGSQSTYIDVPYAPGPLTSGNAYQLTSTQLDQDALTRPNQKVLEVLAATSFATTLGTGRYAGDASTSPLNFKDVAYEDPTVYPPTSGIADRPKALPGNFDALDAVGIGTEYQGAPALPLGALFRDKDFHGQSFGNNTKAALVLFDEIGPQGNTSLATDQQLEQEEVSLSTASSGVCSPGDILVHVDGEQGNYSLLTNFRTTRGGSVFTASGGHPGGELDFIQPSVTAAAGHTNIIQGRAMLVRNAVTYVGTAEVSAGDELMLLLITTVQQLKDANEHEGRVAIGTQGLFEGYSAAGLCRIEGHPLTRNNVRMQIDPSSIALARRST